MRLFDMFARKNKPTSKTEQKDLPIAHNPTPKIKSSFSKSKEYIYLYGSDTGAAHICGNIIVVDNVPCVITTPDGNYEQISWDILKEKAKTLSLSTFLWIKDINSDNWMNYAFTFRPHEQPKDIDFISIFVFPNSQPYSNPAFDEVVIGKHDKKPYIRHSVGNGHSGHDPWFVSVSIETTFADIRQVAKELNLNAYIVIDENNWIDKIETFGGSNVYQLSANESVLTFIKLLSNKNVVLGEIEITPLFKQENESVAKMSAGQFFDSFTANWRMFEFKIQCSNGEEKFTARINGLTREVVASWPIDINQIIS